MRVIIRGQTCHCHEFGLMPRFAGSRELVWRDEPPEQTMKPFLVWDIIALMLRLLQDCQDDYPHIEPWGVLGKVAIEVADDRASVIFVTNGVLDPFRVHEVRGRETQLYREAMRELHSTLRGELERLDQEWNEARKWW